MEQERAAERTGPGGLNGILLLTPFSSVLARCNGVAKHYSSISLDISSALHLRNSVV